MFLKAIYERQSRKLDFYLDNRGLQRRSPISKARDEECFV
jgi:hypothetical protein